MADHTFDDRDDLCLRGRVFSDDRDLDETLDETFPASDPPANTVETGIRIGTGSSAPRGRIEDIPGAIG
jgi:hypothetical protein